MSIVCDEELVGPAVWRGDALAPDRWLRMLDRAELAAVEALRERLAGVPLGDVAAGVVAVDGGLAKVAEWLVEGLERGSGVVVLRGLPVGEWSLEDTRKVYLALARAVGEPVSVNRLGEVMSSVRSRQVVGTRGYGSRGEIAFHSDLTDVVSLLCLTPAERGGESQVVSTLELHNIVRREHPDYLPLLYQSFAVSWKGEQPPGEPGWYGAPVFSYYRNVLSARVTLAWIREAAEQFDDVLDLTDREREAFDFFDSLAWRPGMSLDFAMEPGDIQMLNNWVTVHCRSPYEDHPTDPARQRHLLRLWLSRPHPQGRPLAPELARWRHGIMPWDRESVTEATAYGSVGQDA